MAISIMRKLAAPVINRFLLGDEPFVVARCKSYPCGSTT
jgi:hypothetical protein